MSFDKWTMCIMTLFPSYLIKSVWNPNNLVNQKAFYEIQDFVEWYGLLWFDADILWNFNSWSNNIFTKFRLILKSVIFDEMLSPQPLLWKTTQNTINLFMEWMFALIWISFRINSSKLAIALNVIQRQFLQSIKNIFVFVIEIAVGMSRYSNMLLSYLE